MKQYLGVKLISAEICSQEQFAGAKNFGDLSKLSGGIDKEGYKVVYEDGYTSWSPKEVFEKAYKELGDISVVGIAKRIAACTPPSPAKHRMVEELSTLVARVDKLDDFTKTVIYSNLDVEIQNLLALQLNSMKLYLSVLIERFEKME